MSTIFLFLMLALPGARASIFGEETAVLLQVVANQVSELNKLADEVGISRENRDLLEEINQGVDQSVRQIEAIQSIVDRAQGLDPSGIRDLSDLNRVIEQVKDLSADTVAVLSLKLGLCDQSISQSAIQSDTAYKMGQEMVGVGSQLAQESRAASPGRASQISAAAASSQMLASGVQLQTLAHLVQLQALSLDLQKSAVARSSQNDQAQRAYLGMQLQAAGRKRAP
jgi:hypothetical protein